MPYHHAALAAAAADATVTVARLNASGCRLMIKVEVGNSKNDFNPFRMKSNQPQKTQATSSRLSRGWT